MQEDALSRLASAQRSDGCFVSQVVARGRRFPDHNGFTAALVLRTLRHAAGSPGLSPIRRKALAYIARCSSRSVPGAFGFWPRETRPAWASRLDADLDDTALMSLELLRAGAISEGDVQQSLAVLSAHRAPADALRPPWIATGAFATWVAPRSAANPVDCTVNANVAALLARMEARAAPGYREAMQTIHAGIEWAAADPARLRSLSPFYPSPWCLLDALEHAVECGVAELAACRAALHRQLGSGRAEAGLGCCSSAYGSVVWHCTGVDVARELIS